MCPLKCTHTHQRRHTQTHPPEGPSGRLPPTWDAVYADPEADTHPCPPTPILILFLEAGAAVFGGEVSSTWLFLSSLQF